MPRKTIDRTTAAGRRALFHRDVRGDGHGNAHSYGDAVTGTIVAYPQTGTPLDLLNLRRVRAVVGGNIVEANWSGSEEVGTEVRAIPHVINGKVWSFVPASV